ncbi:bacillithiol biosynthesis cysteine-adding enzyme BshC [Peribacillus sp. SCS-155]|uniref:bacillithiol biosynthesis cysteine-adding enzyme BshC n=1 Tax=Peribacillus sedimenti TaxID=3115297 RepID=UPI0039068598
MEIKDLEIPSLNQFASDYSQGNLEAEDYFHYSLSDPDLFQKRYSDLMTRSFMRAELADYIYGYMAKFTLSDKVLTNIKDLQKEDSVVVIGGQQAGLLSGPLYTIHKVISIIKLAKQQEKALNKKVIPVFWIAGEDHDLAEVNHVYALKGEKPEKVAFPLYHPFKTMVSDLALDPESAVKWIEEIMETYGETDFTQELLDKSKSFLRKGGSFVDFFASLINDWFAEYGLLLLDAADPKLRKIESGYFLKLIDQAGPITEAVLEQQAFMREKGYKRIIEMESDAANIFYCDPEKNERILLQQSASNFKGKDGIPAFSKSELLAIADRSPERLSNNVVTRPIMQEMLFPVLAFISGPGEIAYWAELKRAFELFDIKMPPIIPRLNISILERGIATDIEETGVGLIEVLTAGTAEAEKRYLEEVKDDTVESLFAQTRANLEENHLKFSSKAGEFDKGLQPLLEKNRKILLGQLDFAHSRFIKSTRERHSIVLEKYNRIETSLHPLGSPQERIWTVFYYLNKYGPDFIADLMQLDYEFNNKHKVIYI